MTGAVTRREFLGRVVAVGGAVGAAGWLMHFNRSPRISTAYAYDTGHYGD